MFSSALITSSKQTLKHVPKSCENKNPAPQAEPTIHPLKYTYFPWGKTGNYKLPHSPQINQWWEFLSWGTKSYKLFFLSPFHNARGNIAPLRSWGSLLVSEGSAYTDFTMCIITARLIGKRLGRERERNTRSPRLSVTEGKGGPEISTQLSPLSWSESSFSFVPPVLEKLSIWTF